MGKSKPAKPLFTRSDVERHEMAKQLHEGLLQTLSAASILSRVVSLRIRNTPESVSEIQRLQEMIDTAIDQTRALLRQLQAPAPEGNHSSSPGYRKEAK